MEALATELKNTALTDVHVKLGAKMVPFAGYNMPVSYEGINAEHETVRKGVGVFDVSHMGEFILKGLSWNECVEPSKILGAFQILATFTPS